MKFILGIVIFCLSTFAFSGPVIGDVRGVTLQYIDKQQEDILWILDTVDTGTASDQQRIKQRLNVYASSGVNWLRILTSPNWGPTTYPDATTYAKKINKLMAFIRANNPGQFNIELLLSGKMLNQSFVDPYPYTNDQAWYRSWMQNLDATNLGMIMFAGDMLPCTKWGNTTVVSCYNPSTDSVATTGEAYYKNNGRWLIAMYNWFKSSYPGLNIGFEIGGGGDLDVVAKTAAWTKTYFPALPIYSTALYINMYDSNGQPSENWTVYRAAFETYLKTAETNSGKTVWIDELGFAAWGDRNAANYRGEYQKNAYFQGALAQLGCYATKDYPVFAWVGGDDYNSSLSSHTDIPNFAMFKGNQALSSWNTLSLYYKLTLCP